MPSSNMSQKKLMGSRSSMFGMMPGVAVKSGALDIVVVAIALLAVVLFEVGGAVAIRLCIGEREGLLVSTCIGDSLVVTVAQYLVTPGSVNVVQNGRSCSRSRLQHYGVILWDRRHWRANCRTHPRSLTRLCHPSRRAVGPGQMVMCIGPW